MTDSTPTLPAAGYLNSPSGWRLDVESNERPDHEADACEYPHCDAPPFVWTVLSPDGDPGYIMACRPHVVAVFWGYR